jgi:pyruvate formate lyase activating enzyme
VAFFQGCNLRCRYCHNPDTWTTRGGKSVTVEELVADVLKYRSFIERSGGGFTAGGGEPLMQAESLAVLFAELKRYDIHTAIDTSGNAEINSELLQNTDLVLLDIKSANAEKYRALTGADITPFLRFAEALREFDIPVWARYVVVPGLTDDDTSLSEAADFLRGFPNIQRAELLPFHKMGEHKWAALGLPYSLSDTPVPDETVMERAETALKSG